MYLTEL